MEAGLGLREKIAKAVYEDAHKTMLWFQPWEESKRQKKWLESADAVLEVLSREGA